MGPVNAPASTSRVSPPSITGAVPVMDTTSERTEFGPPRRSPLLTDPSYRLSKQYPPPVRRVVLGRTGIEVSQVILGCGSIGGMGSARETWGRYGQNETEAQAMLDAAVGLGINVVDTANSYAGGRSEEVIGRWIAQRGADVLVATKVGNLVEPGQEAIDLSAPHILRQARASVGRLGLSRIDLYMAHAPDDRTPIEETLEAFAELIEQGRVRAIGVCNVTRAQLQTALDAADRFGLPRYEWVQNEYNLLARSDEASVMPLCAERGLSYMPHSPLCGGILSGKYRPGTTPPPDSRLAARPADYEPYLSADASAGVQRLVGEAERLDVSPSGLALAWVMSRAHVTAPVIGPRRLEHLTALREALALRLDPDDQDRVASLVSAATV